MTKQGKIQLIKELEQATEAYYTYGSDDSNSDELCKAMLDAEAKARFKGKEAAAVKLAKFAAMELGNLRRYSQTDEVYEIAQRAAMVEVLQAAAGFALVHLQDDDY